MSTVLVIMSYVTLRMSHVKYICWSLDKLNKCLILSLSHSLTLSLSHSFTLDMLNNFCFHVNAQKSLSHFLSDEQLLLSCLCSEVTLSFSHSHTFLFTHSRHAEQLLFWRQYLETIVGDNTWSLLPSSLDDTYTIVPWTGD